MRYSGGCSNASESSHCCRVDVGGRRKGLNAVALRSGTFVVKQSQNPEEILRWCIEQCATVVGVDAPCAWSQCSSSRLCERELKIAGKKVHCYATPTQARAAANETDFYGWVFNGLGLYRHLRTKYGLYDGCLRYGPICFETYPHAVVCALAGSVSKARPKNEQRREVLRKHGYDDSPLTNLDFVDAALCALTAENFLSGTTSQFGNSEEGFIVVPHL